MLNITVDKVYRFDGDRALKAFVDIDVNEALRIKGLKVVEGKNGLFVSMPQEQSKDKKWYDIVRCLDTELRDEISRVVLEEYHNG